MNWKAVTAAIVVLLMGGLGAGEVRDSRIAADFPAVRALSSEADVRLLMGEPRQVLRSCLVFDTSVTPNCDHVFIYRSIFAPLKSRYWLIFFDENSRVTATSSQVEP